MKDATLWDVPPKSVTIQFRDIPYVYFEGLPFPVALTGPGGKTLQNKAMSDKEFEEKLGRAVLQLMSDGEVQRLISGLINEYGEIENLNVNFAPSTLEFNGFSASLKNPSGGVHRWNINLEWGSIVLRPEKGNQVLQRIPLGQEVVNKLRNAASELMELMEIAKTGNDVKSGDRKVIPIEVTERTSTPQTPPTSAPAPAGLQLPPEFPPQLAYKYTEVELIGKGGFANVYKAKRRDDGKIVALKIPHIDERTSSLFIKEVAAWYNLNHKNIVRLYRADILPVPYLEMEFVEGAEVDGKLARDLDKYPKPVDEKTALKLIEGIAEGLKHAHSKGIYHLDLKPLNILLKSDLTPKITDWGLAKISARSSLSQHYGYSPLYAAPEQLDEAAFGVPDHRTDIYQLGLIFYELLTGELPYKATSPGALVGKILHSKPEPVSGIKPDLKKFDSIFEKLLAKRKEDRYQSVDEFLSALESLEELEREKEELRKTSLAMRKSRSREEFERLKAESVRKTVKIAILSAKLNDKAELLAALEELKFYTVGQLDDLLNAIEQVESLLREGIPISAEVEEMVRALVLRIEGEVLRSGK
ncbi:serine/threonine-protein kinase [Thermococcus zilligii]|uniref:serine/threonine-protein kinase n=1 Tax=Thermococcus zilligii TaxID=54076 RepID=UPI00029A08FF|nr:serine/threonine-protein kinase [Thermococcus zilligii]